MGEEFMSIGIEKVIKANNENVKNEDYKSYFYQVLLSVRNEHHRVNKKIDFIEDYNNRQVEEQEDNNYQLALKAFLSKNYKDEKKKFYQDLILLKLTMSKLCLSKKIGMHRTKLDQYLTKAENLIKDEYNKLVNC